MATSAISDVYKTRTPECRLFNITDKDIKYTLKVGVSLLYKSRLEQSIVIQFAQVLQTVQWLPIRYLRRFSA